MTTTGTAPTASTYDVLGTRERPTLGLDTFGDAPVEGAPHNHAQTIREVVAEAVLADRLGIDYLGGKPVPTALTARLACQR